MKDFPKWCDPRHVVVYSSIAFDIAQRNVDPLSVYSDGVLCLRHDISMWQFIGQSTTATRRHRRMFESDVLTKTNKLTMTPYLYTITGSQATSRARQSAAQISYHRVAPGGARFGSFALRLVFIHHNNSKHRNLLAARYAQRRQRIAFVIRISIYIIAK